MRRLAACLAKEFLVLVRDRAGLAVLFLMPMALIFIITVIQDNTFRSVNETKVPLLLVDLDRDQLGDSLKRDLSAAGFFELRTELGGRELTEEMARGRVAAGEFLMAVVVPPGTTAALRQRASARFDALLGEPGSARSGGSTAAGEARPEIRLYFDPATKRSFKTTVGYAIRAIVSGLEVRTAMQELRLKAGGSGGREQATGTSLVTLRESYASDAGSPVIPNSVQHNVPAWTLFAMFFIVIPLAGNIIKERDDGSALRLQLLPGSYLVILLGKMLLYMGVCLAQFLLMLSVGRYLLPLIGLPTLEFGRNHLSLVMVAGSAALAAVGYGLLVGTVAGTQEQASTFGSVSVIILAALGGVFVPVFAMPEFMRRLSGISPLNWGLEGFYDVFLRDAPPAKVLPQCLKLLFMAAGGTVASLLVQKRKTVG